MYCMVYAFAKLFLQIVCTLATSDGTTVGAIKLDFNSSSSVIIHRFSWFVSGNVTCLMNSAFPFRLVLTVNGKHAMTSGVCKNHRKLAQLIVDMWKHLHCCYKQQPVCEKTPFFWSSIVLMNTFWKSTFDCQCSQFGSALVFVCFLRAHRINFTYDQSWNLDVVPRKWTAGQCFDETCENWTLNVNQWKSEPFQPNLT